MATDAKSLYATSLRNTHALETQGLQQMESQVGGLENYPEYAAALRRHIEVTRGQIKRLDDALAALGDGASSFKEAVTNTAGRVGAAVHALSQDETLKNLYAGFGYQYDQIAAYRSLVVFAEKAGQSDHVAGFKQAVEEEEKGARDVDGLIETVTKQYIERTLSGGKADS